PARHRCRRSTGGALVHDRRRGDRLRWRRACRFRIATLSPADDHVTLVAFDLIEVDGLDLRCEPIEERKAELTKLLLSCRPALVVNRVFDAPGRRRGR